MAEIYTGKDYDSAGLSPIANKWQLNRGADAPNDPSMVFSTKAKLDAYIKKTDAAAHPYDGQIVAVVDDSTADNNGIYYITDISGTLTAVKGGKVYKNGNGVTVNTDDTLEAVAKEDGGLAVDENGIYIDFASDSDIADMDFNSSSGTDVSVDVYDNPSADTETTMGIIVSVAKAMESDTVVAYIEGYFKDGGEVTGYMRESSTHITIAEGKRLGAYTRDISSDDDGIAGLLISFPSGYTLGSTDMSDKLIVIDHETD